MWHSRDLSDAWGLGRITWSEFTPATARYTAHYTADKLKKYSLDEIDPETGLKPYERMDASGEVHHLVHEFQRQSLKPGIGIPWLEKNWREVFPADSIVMDGRELPVPRAYFNWLKKNHPDVAEKVKQSRVEYINSRPYIPGVRQAQMAECKDIKLSRLTRHKDQGKSI